MTKQEIIKKVTTEFADQGLLIEGGWQAFLAIGALPPDAPAIQIEEMRKAYFLGAQHLYTSIMGMLEPDAEPTVNDMRRMGLIHEELRQFFIKLKASKLKQN